MKLVFAIGIIIVVIICVWIIFRIITYNNLIKLRNKVKNSWAQIDAQLQRRFDLIPNLVNTVKGFTIHEKQIIENVAKTQNSFSSAHTNIEKIAMNTQLSSQLKTLYVTVNSYPDLKSDANFLKLQAELAEIEEDITYARQFYNDAVTIYNNKLMVFPNNIIAKKYDFKEEKLFDAIAEAENTPKVNFQIRQSNNCKNCGATLQENDTHCQYCGYLCD